MLVEIIGNHYNMYSKGYSIIQHGAGVPSHSAKIGIFYVNDTNNDIYVNINNTTGWRRYYPSSGTWANRPLTGNNNGDYYTVTGGATYRWTSAIGEWVRDFVYGGSPLLSARLTGAVTPENETPVWFQVAGAGSSISSNGTTLTFVKAATTQAYAQFGIASSAYTRKGFQGYFTVSGPGSSTSVLANGRSVVWVRNGSDDGLVSLSMASDSGRVRFYASSSGAAVGRSLVNTTLSSETYVEGFTIDTATSKYYVVYVNNGLYPIIEAVGSELPDNATHWFFIGGYTTVANDGATTAVRQAFFYEF